MKHSIWHRGLLGAGMAVGCLCLALRPSEAAEEARRFLDALRERGYVDTALEYLEQMRTSKVVGKEFREIIDYEAGVTLIHGSRAGRVRSEQEKQLGLAKDRFEKFIQGHTGHPLVRSANTYLANLQVERGQLKVRQSESPRTTAEEKKQLLDEARALYQSAEKVLTALKVEFVAEYKTLPKLIDPADTEKKAAKAQLQKDILQVQVRLATVAYEVSKTYAPDSKGRKDALADSAAKYGKVYEDYSDKGGGLYSRLWEGRSYKELEKYPEAFDAFEDILVIEDDTPAFRLLKNKTLILLLETCLQSKDAQTYQKGLDEFGLWKKSTRGAEETSEEGLAIQYLAGEVMYSFAMTLEKAEAGRQRAGLLREARKLFEFVVSRSVSYRNQAVAAIQRPEFDGGKPPPPPKDFAGARARAQEAIATMQNPDVVEEEQLKARAEAIKFYRLALRLKTDEVGIDDLNLVRYHLAYLYYLSEDLYEAAVLGEFLARHYPNSQGGRRGAEMAMNAHVMLYKEADAVQKTAEARLEEARQKGADPAELDRLAAEAENLARQTRFCTAQMVKIAEYLATRWKERPEAEKALAMLIGIALQNNELVKARQYLAQIPPESPRRGELQLLIGRRLWSIYLETKRRYKEAKAEQEKSAALPDQQRPEEAQLQAAQEKLDALQARLQRMLEEVQKTFEEGIAAMRKSVDEGGEPTPVLLTSVLSLAQIFISTQQPQQAVDLLNDPKIGPVPLANEKHPATLQGTFRVQTYKAALQAYVAVQELEKVGQTMDALDALVTEGDDPEAAQKLTAIYIRLGLQLEKTLQELRQENKIREAAKVSTGFELFLDRIGSREKGNTFATLAWVARTFYKLGAEFDSDEQELPEAARQYYEKAAQAYRAILDRYDEEGFHPPQPPAGGDPAVFKQKAQAQLKVRLTRCLSKLGEYEQARDILLEILERKEATLDAQLQAAYNYQEWGKVKPDAYHLAMSGDRQYPEIWGWNMIIRRVQRIEKLRPVFHEACYNYALCRFRQARQASKADRVRLFKKAETDILKVNALYQNMGGEEWFGKYDELLKRIRRLLKPDEEPEGLKQPELNLAEGESSP